MAIVRMTRVCVVGPLDERERALRAIASAGVLHLRERSERAEPASVRAVPAPVRAEPAAARAEPGAGAPDRMAELEARRERVARGLESLPPGGKTEPWPGADAAEAELVRIEACLDARDQARAALERLRHEQAQAEPWGALEPEARQRLVAAGLTVAVFEGRRAELRPEHLQGLDWSAVSERPGGRVRVQVVTRGEVALPLDRLPPPPRSPRARRGALEGAAAALEQAEERLRAAGARRPLLERYRRWLDDEVALLAAREGLDERGPVFVVDGYCPTDDRLDRLRSCCTAQALVLVHAEPQPDEPVPIALRNGPIVRTFEPLVAAFKLPTYGELDPTPLLAPFMGLFFGLCLGDLGYGAVLTVIAGGLLLRGRLPPPARALLRWALVLGVAATGVGALLGNLFGLRLHALLGVEPSALLFSLVEDPGRLLVVSLALGVLQLHLGMALRLWRDLAGRRIQAALGSLAWLGVIPTLGLAAAGVLPWWPLGLVGAGLLLFAAPGPSLLRRLGGGAWALYDVSGLLANVFSYARIFGLGLSSGIIAMVVNTIAAVLATGPVGTVAAILVLVVGHAFNFAMAVVGAVVHPARLQLLEFFNTFFSGGGRAYDPLRRTCQGE